MNIKQQEKWLGYGAWALVALSHDAACVILYAQALNHWYAVFPCIGLLLFSVVGWFATHWTIHALSALSKWALAVTLLLGAFALFNGGAIGYKFYLDSRRQAEAAERNNQIKTIREETARLHKQTGDRKLAADFSRNVAAKQKEQGTTADDWLLWWLDRPVIIGPYLAAAFGLGAMLILLNFYKGKEDRDGDGIWDYQQAPRPGRANWPDEGEEQRPN